MGKAKSQAIAMQEMILKNCKKMIDKKKGTIYNDIRLL